MTHLESRSLFLTPAVHSRRSVKPAVLHPVNRLYRPAGKYRSPLREKKYIIGENESIKRCVILLNCIITIQLALYTIMSDLYITVFA